MNLSCLRSGAVFDTGAAHSRRNAAVVGEHDTRSPAPSWVGYRFLLRWVASVVTNTAWPWSK
jgi:hypothetical protein